MLRVYGTMMPLRVLEEVRFWKMQEKEHTLVIRQIAPGMESRYVHLMGQWELVFAQTELAATRWIEALIRSPQPAGPETQRRIHELTGSAMAQSVEFIRQLVVLMESAKPLKESLFAKTVVQHIIRESEYFLGVLQAGMSAVQDGRDEAASASAAKSSGPERAREPGALKERTRERVKLHIAEDTREEASLELTSTGEGVWTPFKKTGPVPPGGHTLPPLPYGYDALEPFIDAETMRLHHDKHHQSYVDGLNRAEEALAEARAAGDFSLVKHWERELAFHGAGHYLHTLFWQSMKPKGGKPGGSIAAELAESFGSWAAFQRHFSEAADQVEGGGWAVLVWSPRSRRLDILQAEKHQNLSQWDIVPLLTLDVWEHAYYLKYNNQRRNYIDAWWNVVNWDFVNDRFEKARKLS